MGDIADMMLEGHDPYDDEGGGATDTLRFTEIIKKTDKAWNLKIGGKDYWLPKSQCTVNEKDNTVEIPYWLLRKNSL